jgi:rhamnogalacturonan endolyase
MWSQAGGLWNVSHTKAGNNPSSDNFTVWWDSTLNRAVEDGTSITRYDGVVLLNATGCASNNGTKSTPCLTADIFGDWREEVVYRATDNSALRIYTTTTPTTHRLYTLMHDPIYRMSVATENVGYNQPPEPGIYIGPGMTLPQPKPNITYYDGSVGVEKGQTKALFTAGREPSVIMAAADRTIALPAHTKGQTLCVSVYDVSGKRVRLAFVNESSLDLRKKLGVPDGLYLVRVNGKR